MEDFDWAIGGPGDEAPPVAKAYEATVEAIESVGHDPTTDAGYWGRLERAGLEETGSEGGRSCILARWSPGTAFDRFSMLVQREALLGSRALTEPDLEETLRYLDDPAVHVLTPVLFAAWGRKPA